MTKVSIIVPVYNEARCISQTLQRLTQTTFPGIEKEVIVVDDGSTDETREHLKQLQDSCTVVLHPENRGKGAAVRTGLGYCHGDIIAIQDSDLEYDPADLVTLVVTVATGHADVVYGSRMIGANPVGYFFYYIGNQCISFLASVCYGCRLTDVETGYKVFRASVVQPLVLECNDFGFEIEITAKLRKAGVRIPELPISYHPRTFRQGKKINARDGLKALWLILWYRFH